MLFYVSKQLVENLLLVPLKAKLLLDNRVYRLPPPSHAQDFQLEGTSQCTNTKTINCLWCVHYYCFIHVFKYDRLLGCVKHFFQLKCINFDAKTVADSMRHIK